MPEGVPKLAKWGLKRLFPGLWIVKAHFQRAGPQIITNIVRITTIWGDLVLNGDSEGRKGLIWVPESQPVN